MRRQRYLDRREYMRLVFQIISYAALVGTVLPSIFYLAGSIPLDMAKWMMLLATVIWFASALLWMGKEDPLSKERP